MNEEKSHLESIAAVSRYAQGANEYTIKYSFDIFRRYLQGKTLLEMGPAEGVMTDLLAELPFEMTVVEGSSLFCKALKQRHPKIEVIESLFENYQPAKTFDNIVLGHVLEHVEDPVMILKQVKKWLGRGGRVMAAVPNSRSLHRQAAVIMGLLDKEDSLNEADRHHGHRRVYSPESFRANFMQAGLKVEIFGGYWLKPLSNAQIEETWNDEMFQAFMQLGERYPDIAGEIYVVAG